MLKAYSLLGTLLIIVIASKAHEDHGKSQVPPPPPTPLDFPCCRPTASNPRKSDPTLDILKLFSNILRTGPSRRHLEALNVNLEDNVPLDQLVPQAHLPPLEWAQDPAKSRPESAINVKPPPNVTLSNGGPLPGHEAFFTRVRELSHDNDAAFQATEQRGPRKGVSGARILHFRKFWEHLLLMSKYWDTSQDNYSKATPSAPTVHPPSQSAMDVDTLACEAQNADSSDTTSEAQSEETYTGRRNDTGRNMPPKFREETIFNFIEPLTWVFRCRLEHAKLQPKVKISGMMLPLPHNGNIYRTPEDPRQARRGILEGPLAGVFCRDQLTFRRPDDAEGEGKQEILDLLREVGVGLMLAQKRAREGTKEEVPGERQWWATKPRWGGGKGGEMGLSEEETVVSIEETPGVGKDQPPGKRPRRLDRASAWKEVRPPATTWEKGITYMKIGCGKGSDIDDVGSVVVHAACELTSAQIYLFSALNHHISIVHLRVYHRYIEHLGKQHRKSKVVPLGQPWYRLEMRRTRWYDLFSMEDRVEAMRGIWAVMGCLMRRPED